MRHEHPVRAGHLDRERLHAPRCITRLRQLPDQGVRHRVDGAEYKSSVAAFCAATARIPAVPKQQRELLTHVLQTHPEIRSVTLQHREFSELTDSDVQSLLRQLEQLGMLQGLNGGSHGE